MEGILGLPVDPRGIAVSVHGSGSGRFSPRNMFVAHQLQRDGFATLLLDLLTDEEADDRRKVFDIDLLANRLLLAKRWLEAEPRTQHLKIGYFGASTGAGVALQTAARGAEDDDQLLFAGQQIAGCLVHLNHRFIMATDDQ